MRLSPAPLSVGLASLLLALAPGRAETYSLYRVGLTGGAFANSTGVEWSEAKTLENGIVAGTSRMTIETTSGGGSSGGGLTLGGATTIGGGIVIIGGGTGGGSLTLVSAGYAPWVANAATGVTTRVGLYGAEFTKSDGLQNGTLLGLSGGYAAGQATRYSGGSSNGEASWIANATTGATTRIGFYDANYTFVDGSQDTHVQYVQGGYAAGYSTLAVGGSGTVTWAATGTTGVTARVGLFGAGYTTDSGLQNSAVRGLRDGVVIGESDRYTGEASFGTAAWMTNIATGVTTQLGFTDAAHTWLDGSQMNRAQYIKDGYVAGWSRDSGFSSHQWVAPVSTGAPLQVGLTSSAYTSSDGTQLTYADLLSDGYVAGQSYIYNGANYAGHAAWVSSAATNTTRRIGIFDTAQYFDNQGRPYSVTSHLTGSYVAGFSRQYSGSVQIGTAVWVAPVAAGNTVRVGLYDAAFTNSDGGQSSSVSSLKGEYVAGTSTRYLGGNTSLGPRAWIADASTGATTALGMTDAAHTSDAGIQWSNANILTATGYLAGSSNVYSGSTYFGDTAWIWDANTLVFDPIELSINPTTGAAVSYITQLFDNGVAVGNYELFDGTGTSLGSRPFLWTVADGEVDLTSLVDGGLSAQGWSLLNNALLANPSLETIIGHGRVPANAATQAVYVAVPAPEPGSTVLLALGALGLGGRRRRRP